MQFKLKQEENGNMKKFIQSAVVKELTNILDPGKAPYQPKRGK